MAPISIFVYTCLLRVVYAHEVEGGVNDRRLLHHFQYACVYVCVLVRLCLLVSLV
jgi:hypothetical protein